MADNDAQEQELTSVDLSDFDDIPEEEGFDEELGEQTENAPRSGTLEAAFAPLANRDVWCGYILKPREVDNGDGTKTTKFGKPPVNPHPRADRKVVLGKPNEPSQFGTYQEAKNIVGSPVYAEWRKKDQDGRELSDQNGNPVYGITPTNQRVEGIGVKLGPLPPVHAAEGEKQGEQLVLAGIDIDDCVDAEGNLNDTAQEILKMVPKTYAEYSVSGKGIHLLMLVKPETQIAWNKNTKLELEMYVGDRYFTVSERPIRMQEIRDRSEQFLEVAKKFAPNASLQHQSALNQQFMEHHGPQFTPITKEEFDELKRRTAQRAQSSPQDNRKGGYGPKIFSDDELWERMSHWSSGDKISRLRSGNINDYPGQNGPDPSAATMGLLYYLAYATQYYPDHESRLVQMERMFRSTGIEADKFDSRRGGSTWGIQQIEIALSKNPLKQWDSSRAGKSGSGRRTRSGTRKASKPKTNRQTQQKAPGVQARLPFEDKGGQGSAPAASVQNEPVRPAPAAQDVKSSQPPAVQSKPEPPEKKSAEQSTRPAAQLKAAPAQDTSPPVQGGDAGFRSSDRAPEPAPAAAPSRSGALFIESRAAESIRQVEAEGPDRFIEVVAANPQMSPLNQMVVHAQMTQFPETFAVGPVRTAQEWSERGYDVPLKSPIVLMHTLDPKEPSGIVRGFCERDVVPKSETEPAASVKSYTGGQVMKAFGTQEMDGNADQHARELLKAKISEYVDVSHDYAVLSKDEKAAVKTMTARITAQALGIPYPEPPKVPMTPNCTAKNVMAYSSRLANRCVRVTSHAIETGRQVQKQKQPPAQKRTQTPRVQTVQPASHRQPAAVR